MGKSTGVQARKRGGMEQNVKDNTNTRPFGIKDKIGYMFGDFGNDFSFIFASTYLMIFYTKVLGIKGAVVGMLFLGARVVDAFTDVTMGRIVDSMKPAKDGRFRPWIRRMCVPVAIASTLMYGFFVRDWPYGAKMTYVVITYLLWGSFCYTAINIPYGSMASVISPEAGDRASLSTFRSVGASLASLVIGTLGPLLVYGEDEAGNQIVNPLRLTAMAAIFGVCAIICYLLCYYLCVERVHFEPKGKGQRESAGELVKSLLRNRPLFALVGAALVLLLATLIGQAMNNYLFLDYFRNAKAIAALNFVSMGGMLVLAPFVSRIAVKFGKKEAGAAGMLFAGIVYLIIFFLRIHHIVLYMVLFFLATMGVGLFNMIIWAYITDIIDHQEVQTGKREDGTVYAIYSFARKLGQALAGGVGGFTLTAIGYASEATSQTVEVTNRIYTVATLVPGICYLIVFFIMQTFYPLTKRVVEENAAILREQHK